MANFQWIEDERIETTMENVIDCIIYADDDEEYVDYLIKLGSERLGISEFQLAVDVAFR
jgi:hypothetical protein